MGNSLGKKKKAQVLVLGLDNSGKTTVIKCLQSGNNKVSVVLLFVYLQTTAETVPTVGYHQETFNKNKISFTAFDMSGQVTTDCCMLL